MTPRRRCVAQSSGSRREIAAHAQANEDDLLRGGVRGEECVEHCGCGFLPFVCEPKPVLAQRLTLARTVERQD